jgi:hypothetical protein
MDKHHVGELLHNQRTAGLRVAEFLAQPLLPIAGPAAYFATKIMK